MVETKVFGISADNKTVMSYVLKNSNGMSAEILDYGCILRSLFVPDKDGKFRDVVLGYDNIASYENDAACFGAFVGRYANRIKNSSFVLNGIEYQIEPNEGKNHLHGKWKNTVFSAVIGENSVAFNHFSTSDEEGYPGNVDVCVVYTLTDSNELILDITSTPDKDTVINTTTHTYFNLNGHASGGADEQFVAVNSDFFLEPDFDSCPTGKILSVENTPFDLRKPVKIGTGRNSSHQLIRRVNGFDHCYVANDNKNAPNASAYSCESGIKVDIFFTQPGVQLYSGNYLEGTQKGKEGFVYNNGFGFALEPQQYPCAPNFSHFPSPVVKAGETKTDKIIYKFGLI